MQNNIHHKHKGFTLVELLIVIVVIGVLASMMMLSSTEAVNSAKASNIISNMRNWKTAVLAWYTDNLNKADKSNFAWGQNNVTSKDVEKYLSSESSPGYDVEGKEAGTWFIKYSGTDLNTSVIDKLNARRETVGLTATNNSKDKYPISSSSKAVYLYVR